MTSQHAFHHDGAMAGPLHICRLPPLGAPYDSAPAGVRTTVEEVCLYVAAALLELGTDVFSVGNMTFRIVDQAVRIQSSAEGGAVLDISRAELEEFFFARVVERRLTSVAENIESGVDEGTAAVGLLVLALETLRPDTRDKVVLALLGKHSDQLPAVAVAMILPELAILAMVADLMGVSGAMAMRKAGTEDHWQVAWNDGTLLLSQGILSAAASRKLAAVQITRAELQSLVTDTMARCMSGMLLERHAPRGPLKADVIAALGLHAAILDRCHDEDEDGAAAARDSNPQDASLQAIAAPGLEGLLQRLGRQHAAGFRGEPCARWTDALAARNELIRLRSLVGHYAERCGVKADELARKHGL